MSDKFFPSRWTQFFGPCAWKLLHSVSFTFPDNPSEEQKENYLSFIHALSKVLPCPECQKDMQEYLRENTVDVSSRSKFSTWCVDFHNHVNQKLGKRSVPYEEIARRYSGWTSEDTKKMQMKSESEQLAVLSSPYYTQVDNNHTQVVLFVVAVSVLLILYFFFFKSK